MDIEFPVKGLNLSPYAFSDRGQAVEVTYDL
jgi:hypothetical protein